MHGQRNRFSNPTQLLSRIIPQLSLLCILFCIPAFGQERVNVSVDLSKAVNILTDVSLGVPAPISDGNSFDPAGLPYLRAAGVTTVRYPASHGVADLYHWSTKSITPYKGTEAVNLAPGSDFGRFALFAEKLGQAVVVVNYGSNIDGSGSGEPAEAAAWVAYSNGDAASTQPLGKDSTGKDWRTVGYWAALRGAAPRASDDGLNFLRILHPRPFGFKLWQIGDEVYNNGFYGTDFDKDFSNVRTGNPDLHGPAPAALNDFGKLKHDPKLSPSAYAENLKAFAQAMKAVDPSIKIGATLALPPNPGLHDSPKRWIPVVGGLEWNKNVLQGACSSIDFVALDWSLAPTVPPTWKTLNEEALLDNKNLGSAGYFHSGFRDHAEAIHVVSVVSPNPRFNVTRDPTSSNRTPNQRLNVARDPTMSNQVADSSSTLAFITDSLFENYGKSCPKDHLPKIAFAPVVIGSWEEVEHPVVKALWLADYYAYLIESGVVNISWNEMYGDTMLSADRKTLGPAYYGLQMLHIVAHAPGDAFLDATSSAQQIGVHATYRRDGFIGLMLVNKSLKESAAVTVSYKNGSAGTAGKRFDYGSAQFGAGGPSMSAFTAAGDTFTVTVPPYTITDIVLPNHK
jgi:hypothetical protein